MFVEGNTHANVQLTGTSPRITKHLLFAHAWSECDTTSAIFGHGEGEILKHLQQSKAVRKIAKEFEQDDALLDIEFTGLGLFKKLYNGRENESLNELRYARYMNAIAGSLQSVRPEALPPAESAARFHCQRIYLQVIAWKHQ